MALSTYIPFQIAGYNVLPLSLPPLPSYPITATHYLYLAQHQPKIPTRNDYRSLFLVNVPFDATDLHVKILFSTHLELPAGRIEEVTFEGGKRRNTKGLESNTSKKQEKKGKKRKRESESIDIDLVQGAELPSTWDRDLQTHGFTAVVLFVDQASMEAALKAAKSVRKQSKKIIWGEGTEGKVPALGYASMPLYSPL